MTDVANRGLGRRFAPDDRDQAFPLAAAIPQRIDSTSRIWRTGPSMPLDQGPTPMCVGYAFDGFLLTRPMQRPVSDPAPQDIYKLAQTLDEWPGEDYEGTSVRAGCKALVQLGHVGEYRWAQNVDEIEAYVLSRGPLVFGTNWYDGMDAVDESGFVKPTGNVRGGHAFCCIGYSRTRDSFRFINSWGPTWGQRGRFWMTRKDAEELVFSDEGECVSAIEIVAGATPSS